jgi:lipoate-protein ligase A
MDRWFLLVSPASPGAENMALDETLLERAERGAAPALRLYSFDPPAITIGAHQDVSRALDLDAVRADGVDVVRRVTGGRALLHAGELTYGGAAGARDGRFGRGPAERYRRISEALALALRSLGVAASVSRGEDERGRTAGPRPCLSSVTRWELSVRGRKIAGSAQRGTAAAFLQHGSILLRPGSERIARYVPGPCAPLAGRVTSVREELGRDVGGGELGEAVADAFRTRFGVVWEPLVLDPREREAVDRRARAKRAELASSLGREVVSP